MSVVMLAGDDPFATVGQTVLFAATGHGVLGVLGYAAYLYRPLTGARHTP
ncbi:MAG TPA: hypothetical protein VD813_06475 [Pseudonocardia sp.]|nr:hypothetical protein [Pseudonocardia sp.]